MADFTASTALRNIIAAYLAGIYYWVTLHDATGGFVAGDVYSAGVRGELSSADGYTQGGQALSLSNTNGVLDGPDSVWTADNPGTIGPTSYAAVWMNTSNTIVGAQLLSVDDHAATPQTATNGNQYTAGIANPITIPTPA